MSIASLTLNHFKKWLGSQEKPPAEEQVRQAATTLGIRTPNRRDDFADATAYALAATSGSSVMANIDRYLQTIQATRPAEMTDRPQARSQRYFPIAPTAAAQELQDRLEAQAGLLTGASSQAQANEQVMGQEYIHQLQQIAAQVRSQDTLRSLIPEPERARALISADLGHPAGLRTVVGALLEGPRAGSPVYMDARGYLRVDDDVPVVADPQGRTRIALIGQYAEYGAREIQTRLARTQRPQPQLLSQEPPKPEEKLITHPPANGKRTILRRKPRQ